MREASVVGSAVTFATTGTVGVLITMSAIAAASLSAAGFIIEQWKGALTASFLAIFAPVAFASGMARSTAFV